MKPRILFDFPSIMKTCFLAGIDPEGVDVEHEQQTVHVNSAAYGYENAVNSIKSTLVFLSATPKDAILVVERGSTLVKRRAISPLYKLGRETRPAQFYREYQKAHDDVINAFKSLGATVAYSTKPCEADDVLAFLSTRLDCVVVSNDGDMLALRSPTCDTFVGGVLNSSGKCATRHLNLYKSLVGDKNDGISGCKDFGEKSWLKLEVNYGLDGLDELDAAVQNNALDKVEGWATENEDKSLRKIVEHWKAVTTSYRLAKLYPEWCSIAFEAGACISEASDERLKLWAAKTRLVTADKWEAFVPWFKAEASKSDWISLDIETYTPPESDDWLEAISQVTKGKGDRVDVIGSELAGLSLTFGANQQYSVYIPVQHKDTACVTSEALRDVVMAIEKNIVVHNSYFELPVLKNVWPGVENKFSGYLPNVMDTRIEASYVDENQQAGLKSLSKRLFDYDQTTYEQVTTIEGVKHKMNELTGEHVCDYGADDSRLTSALHNYFELVMRVEGSWDAYLATEIGACYMHADAFVHGVKVDTKKLLALKEADDLAAKEQWEVLNTYLIEKGWEGAVCPQYAEITPAMIKEFVKLATGQEIKTLLKTPAKIIPLVDDGLCRALLESGDLDSINKHLYTLFKPAPILNVNSPKQMAKLLYETMGFPIELRRDATDKMKEDGKDEGNPQTDADAIKFCARHATEEQKKILYALDVISMVSTRNSLFYLPWPSFVHWKTGRVHASHKQCGTTTRRASESSPNRQQLSKHQKVEGFEPKIREIIVPAKRGSVIVSMDESSHELRLAAHYSQDPALLSAFIGAAQDLKDLHSLTGIAILKAQTGQDIDYDEFERGRAEKSNPRYAEFKKARAYGKTTNFLDQYGGGFKKLAIKLLVSHEEAKEMLRAKKAAFSGLKDWTEAAQQRMKKEGSVATLLGARRHLAGLIEEAERGDDPGGPLRQGISFYIQGSGAEHLKCITSRLWALKLKERFPGVQYLASIHDELVFEVPSRLLAQVLPIIHAEMVREHGGITVPLVSSISFGANFGEQIEIGNFPVAQAIEQGLEKMEAA
jgi:DNA polymerase I-like protein with 3'-5' exonuclease and polymerase domains